ncbi:hypothetical protein [Neptunomonas antarctica]|uniref:SMODS and SLOG-associating 2TM effector domain-containing protein n=1 Tax=Neptunomonas antarctica TaxID=619304 RepID=A0A1N7P449_9GAMM|nr:hypothetical protein [Neptunomonas antarctica]SIT05320.1 hypothetical protein SAMN05421760_112108 [Neptunomonas antarctica]
MTDKYQDIAAERQAECCERAAFFDSELRFFSKTNWITLLVPSLLGVVAGSSLFAESGSSWLYVDATTWIGIGTLLAAILTAIHKGLDCDAHQAECRRLVQVYRGLEVRYRTLAQIETPSIIDQLLALESELGELRQSQTATINPQ